MIPMEEDFYINLIYKQLSDEISSEELAALAAWEKNPSNQAIAANVRKAWQASDLLQAKVDVDLDEAFSELEGFMDEEESKEEAQQEETPIVPLRPSNRRRWLSIAAGLALVAVAAFLLRGRFMPENLEWTAVSTLDQSTKVQLVDGTLVTLNQNSQIQFPEVFGRKERKVLLKGEGFFEVQSNPKKPFRVELDQERVSVLGTSFNIKIKDGLTTIYVVEGRVQVDQIEQSKTLILEAGESAESSATGLEKKSSSLELENSIAWKTRKLVFQGSSIQEAIRDINALYQVDLQIESAILKECSLTLTLDQEPLERFFEAMRIINKVQVEQVNEKTYLLKGGSCN